MCVIDDDRRVLAHQSTLLKCGHVLILIRKSKELSKRRSNYIIMPKQCP